MIDPKYIELMNKEIDGLNIAKDSAKLKSYLNREPEAQKQFKHLLAVAKTLEQVKDIQPSPELKKAIVNSINWKKYATEQKKSKAQFGISKLRFNIKYAYVFACGLILGIIGYSSLSDTIKKTDSSFLNGTLMNGEKVQLVDRCDFKNDIINCSLSLKSQDNYLFAELDLTSKQLVQVNLEYDENDLVFKGIQKFTENDVNLDINKKSLSLIQKGTNNYIILLTDRTAAATPLTLRISSGKQQLFEKALSTQR